MQDVYRQWEPQWRDLRDFVYPYIGRFTDEQKNKGERPDIKILDNVVGRALRTLVSGFQSGLTSPSRPWLRLVLADTELSDYPRVRKWLDTCRDIMLSKFRASNFYDVTQKVYRENAIFGSACAIIDEDDKSVFRFRNFTCGEYMIGHDHTQRIDAFAREFNDNAANLVGMFGENKLPSSITNAYRRNDYNSQLYVRHIIMANKFYDSNKFGWENKPFISVYWVPDSKVNDGVLSVTGYDEQPFAVPRWSVIGGDIYGKASPGWETLGDCKQLHAEVESKLEQLDLLTHPPMNGSEDLKAADIVPGGFTALSGNDTKGAWPMFQVIPQLQALSVDIKELHEAIEESFFKPIFLSILAGAERQMTAREIVERHEEKLMMLSPPLDSTQNDYLAPKINRGFNILLRNNYFPPPPDELIGMEIDVEYLGIFAQAQKMMETQKTQDTLTFASTFAQYNPDILDYINFDEAVKVYADGIGVHAKIMRDDTEVQQIREERAAAQMAEKQAQAEQQQAQQLGQNIGQLSQTARNLSQTDTSGMNALSDVVNSLGGAIV